jgi:predicted DsbA family dithiol-disulfide isomerase
MRVSAQSKNEIVAIVNGRNITQEEVDSTIISQLFPLQQQSYALRKAALENLISRTLLEDEAKRRAVSIEELRKQLTEGKVEVSASQVEEVYAENVSAFAAMSPDEARERLRLDLASQARMKLYREALAKLRKDSSVELRLEEPRLPSIDIGTSPSIGSSRAQITVIEFSDFQCPYCKGAQSTLNQVLKNYKTEVRLVFKHLPLDIHAEAFASAQAAFCAGEQGLFWKYHDALFTSDDLSEEVRNNLAVKLHLDQPKFANCLKSPISRAAVLKDTDEARRLGIDATPTFIINGRLFRGVPSLEEFKIAIENELKSGQRPTSTLKTSNLP